MLPGGTGTLVIVVILGVETTVGLEVPRGNGKLPLKKSSMSGGGGLLPVQLQLFMSSELLLMHVRWSRYFGITLYAT